MLTSDVKNPYAPPSVATDPVVGTEPFVQTVRRRAGMILLFAGCFVFLRELILIHHLRLNVLTSIINTIIGLFIWRGSELARKIAIVRCSLAIVAAPFLALQGSSSVEVFAQLVMAISILLMVVGSPRRFRAACGGVGAVTAIAMAALVMLEKSNL